jgi:hypothetical protein
MDLELQAKLLRLKGVLNAANHISYSYSLMGKENPIHTLTNEKARVLIKTYEELIEQLKVVLKTI